MWQRKVTHCSGICVASSSFLQWMSVVRLYLKCQMVCVCDKRMFRLTMASSQIEIQLGSAKSVNLYHR